MSSRLRRRARRHSPTAPPPRIDRSDRRARARSAASQTGACRTRTTQSRCRRRQPSDGPASAARHRACEAGARAANGHRRHRLAGPQTGHRRAREHVDRQLQAAPADLAQRVGSRGGRPPPVGGARAQHARAGGQHRLHAQGRGGRVPQPLRAHQGRFDQHAFPLAEHDAEHRQPPAADRDPLGEHEAAAGRTVRAGLHAHVPVSPDETVVVGDPAHLGQLGRGLGDDRRERRHRASSRARASAGRLPSRPFRR